MYVLWYYIEVLLDEIDIIERSFRIIIEGTEEYLWQSRQKSEELFVFIH